MSELYTNPLFGVPEPERAGVILGMWVGAAVFGNLLALILVAQFVRLQYPSFSMQQRLNQTFLWSQPPVADDTNADTNASPQSQGDDTCKYTQTLLCFRS